MRSQSKNHRLVATFLLMGVLLFSQLWMLPNVNSQSSSPIISDNYSFGDKRPLLSGLINGEVTQMPTWASSEQGAEATRHALSLLAQMDNYQVTLRIIGPDGQPATSTIITILQESLTFSAATNLYYLDTQDTGEVTLNLPRGTYLLWLNREYVSPKFYCIFYLSVTGDNVININVGPLVVPVTMEAINPLIGKDYSGNGEFIVVDTYTLQTYGFGVDEPGRSVVYLPANRKMNTAYWDWAGGYILSKPNITPRGLTTKVQFDGSRTGYLQPSYVLPTTPPSLDYYAGVILWFGNWGFGTLPTTAITVGTYSPTLLVEYYAQEGDIMHYYDYWFNIKAVISAKKTTSVIFGGDLTMTAKASKTTYKPGDEIQIIYTVKDHYGHILTGSYKIDHDVVQDTMSYPQWNLQRNLSVGGVLLDQQVWQSEGMNTPRTDWFWSSQYANSATYIYSVAWDTEVYQGSISSSAKIVIKSASMAPEVDYNHLSGQTIDIGVIAPDTTRYNLWTQYFTDIIQPDLNTYYQDLGLNFQFHVVDAQSDNQVHLNEVMAFHDQGI